MPRTGPADHSRARKTVPLRASYRYDRVFRTGIPRLKDRRARQQLRLDCRGTEPLPEELLPDDCLVACLQSRGDACRATADRRKSPRRIPRTGAFLPQLLHVRVHHVVVGMDRMGTLHRLDGASGRNHAAGHHGAGSRLAAARTFGRRGPRLLHRSGPPALAPHVEHRPLAGSAARGVDRRPAGVAAAYSGARTRTGDETRAAGLRGTRSAGAQKTPSRCPDHTRELLGRLRRSIPVQFPRPDGPAFRGHPAGVPHRTDPSVRHGPYLRRRSVQRDRRPDVGS